MRLLIYVALVGCLFASESQEWKIEDKLTLITSTSPIPSNPSTNMLEITQKSLFKNEDFAKCKKIIVFDGVPPGKEDMTEAYEQYKANAVKLTQTSPYFQNTELVFCEEHMHLSWALREAMKRVTTPFVFVHQHDFLLAKPVDVEGVIRSMEANPMLKHIRLSRRRNMRTYWDGMIDEKVPEPHYVPLCRTFGWSDNDHFSPLSYYQDFVFPRIPRKGPMERFLHRQEKRGLRRNRKAQEIFGTYLYGPKGGGQYIVHLNGKTWNK